MSGDNYDGMMPTGAERENNEARCPNCLHHPMRERDYIHLGTAQESTIQTCPRCHAIRVV